MRRFGLALFVLATSLSAADAARAAGVQLTAIRFPGSLTGSSGPTAPPGAAPLSQVVVFEFSGAPAIPSAGIADGLRIRVAATNNGGQVIGQKAYGTYRVQGNRVVFTPRLPTEPLPPSFGPASDPGDLGLPGLVPATTYEITVTVGTPNSVANLKGVAKGLTLPLAFTTAAATAPGGLFSNAPKKAPRLKKGSVLPKDGTKGLAPNVFSDPAGLFTSIPAKRRPPFRVKFAGPLDPAADNVSSQNVRVRAVQTATGEIEDVALNTLLVLVANDPKGSELLVYPDGVLPLGHDVVLEVSNKLRALSGTAADPSPEPAKFAQAARYRVTPDPTPGVSIDDAILETFQSAARQDATIATAGDQLAGWDAANSNTLRASFGFGGDGSLGRFLPPAHAQIITLDTDFQQLPLFSGATPDAPAGSAVIGGVFNFTDVDIPTDVILRGEGSNPLVITATGDVTILGRIELRGSNGIADQTFNSGTVGVPGGPGGAGAGRGGTGHPVSVPAGAPSLIFMQTPKFGGTGFASGNLIPGGGAGGQCGATVPWTNYNNAANGICTSFDDLGDGSRGSGGGGGSLATFVPPTGPDAGNRLSGRAGGPGIGNFLPITFDPSKPLAAPPIAYQGDASINAVARPNPNMTFGAATEAGLLYDVFTPPNIGKFNPLSPFSTTRRVTFGGAAGEPAFVDADPENDFFGPGGERQAIVAGQGGGSGGSRTEGLDLRCLPTTLFAGNPLTFLDAKGGGGGGGGGAILIQALGTIRFLGPKAEIVARGGAGGGGEAIGMSEQGGSGGGGSGGVVVLQSAVNVEMNDPALGTFTFGGQTRNRILIDVSGGAGSNAVLLTSIGASGTPGADPNALQVGDGGPGGPGVVQIHVPPSAPDLIDEDRVWALAFLSGLTIQTYTVPPAANPVPGGSSILQPLVAREKTPTPFSGTSVAQSTWYDLGAVTSEFRAPILAGSGILPGPVFGTPDLGPFFRGSDPHTGLVQTDAAGNVLNAFANDIDVDAPDLLKPDFIPNGPVHFQTVRVLFEGADDDPANPGSPDLSTATGFVPDITQMNGRRHLRWRIEIDIAPGGAPSVATPRPQVNFLRLPLKY